MSRILLFNQLPFDQLDRSALFEQVLTWTNLRRKKVHLLLNMNAFGVVTYYKNKKYQSLIDRADLILSDGWGPVIASRLTAGVGEALQSRLNVGDFITDLLVFLANNKKTLFLIGAQKKELFLIKKEIENKTGIKVVGFFDGFFGEAEEENLLKKIEKLKPDLVLLGMGVPRQEEFLWRQRRNLPPSVYMIVGGAFHYLSGSKKRAPKWMRKNALEWLFRLTQEPLRLFWRYTVVNLMFACYTLQYFLKEKFKKDQDRHSTEF